MLPERSYPAPDVVEETKTPTSSIVRNVLLLAPIGGIVYDRGNNKDLTVTNGLSARQERDGVANR